MVRDSNGKGNNMSTIFIYFVFGFVGAIFCIFICLCGITLGILLFLESLSYEERRVFVEFIQEVNKHMDNK